MFTNSYHNYFHIQFFKGTNWVTRFGFFFAFLHYLCDFGEYLDTLIKAVSQIVYRQKYRLL